MPPVVFEFEKLLVYQDARAFRVRIYKLAKLLPAFEFKLQIQMRDDEKYAKHEHLEDLRLDAAKFLRRLNGFIKYLDTEGKKLLALKRQNRRTKTIGQITNY